MLHFPELSDLLAAHPEPRVRAIPGRRMFGPDVDAEGHDDSGEEIPSEDIEDLTVGITYADASGGRSERTIRCRRLRMSGNTIYIDAECYLRRAARTFRLDRIEEVIDYTTGEVIYDVAGFFDPYLGAIADRSSKVRLRAAYVSSSANPRIAAAFRDGARVLMYVAMADGELHPAELSLVTAYGVGRLLRIPEPPPNPDRVVRLWIDNHVPTRHSALAALGRVVSNDADGHELAHAIVDLVIADGTASDAEMAIAWSLQKAMEGRARVRPRVFGRRGT